MSTPNPVPEGHVCTPMAIIGSDATFYNCHVCGRRYRRHYDETTKQAGPWREVEPGHPIDLETGGYWSGPTLALVQQHWHFGQNVVAAATVALGEAVGGKQPVVHFTLARDRAEPARHSVFRFWLGPGGCWCCEVKLESKPYEVAAQTFLTNVGRATSEVR